MVEKTRSACSLRGLGLLCCLLPCQKHLVRFGMVLNSASAVPIAGQGALLSRDTWEAPCPVTKGALHCWDCGSSKSQAACGCAGDHWLVIALVPPVCFEPVSHVRKLQVWRVWGVENLCRHVFTAMFIASWALNIASCVQAADLTAQGLFVAQ